MIDIRFDVDAIMDDPSLMTLTWEVIEARGIATGDMVELFKTAQDFGRSCAQCQVAARDYYESLNPEYPDQDVLHVAATYALMSKFLAREAREIVKFLNLRGFIFPEGTTGKRPPDAMGF